MKLECVGGPYDGKSVEFVGPEMKVPLVGSLVEFVPKNKPLTAADCEPRGRVGIYRKLRSAQDGDAAYVWEPTPEVRSLYPEAKP